VLALAATGDGPFGGGSTAALVYHVVHGEPNLDAVPAQVRPLVERCLAKDPGERPTAADLLAGIGAVGVGQPDAGWLPTSLHEVLGRYALPPAGSRRGRFAGDDDGSYRQPGPDTFGSAGETGR